MVAHPEMRYEGALAITCYRLCQWFASPRPVPTVSDHQLQWWTSVCNRVRQIYFGGNWQTKNGIDELPESELDLVSSKDDMGGRFLWLKELETLSGGSLVLRSQLWLTESSVLVWVGVTLLRINLFRFFFFRTSMLSVTDELIRIKTSKQYGVSNIKFQSFLILPWTRWRRGEGRVKGKRVKYVIYS